MNCPCGCDSELYVPFANPIDGGPQYSRQGWKRTGETVDTLTLRPSVLRPKDWGGCGWHGFITDGHAVEC